MCGGSLESGRQMRVWSLKMAIFASFVHCLPNNLHTWPHDSFQVIRLSMTLAILQGHWTVSHQISHKRCVIQQKVLLTTNRKSYTSFRLVALFMTLKYIWRSFQRSLSFLRPFEQPLVCFRVARSPSNSWASCSNRSSWSMRAIQWGRTDCKPIRQSLVRCVRWVASRSRRSSG